MGSFWGPVTKANLERVGPWADIVAGTDGADTDINALVTAGNSKIILGDGAILTASLTITAGGGFLWSPRNARSMNLGAYPLTIDGALFHLEGFGLNGGTGVGIQISTNASAATLHRVRVESFSSHGVQFNNAFNDHEIINSHLLSNGGDGVKIQSGANVVRMIGCMSWDNTGYGVNDTSDSAILVANRLDGNTAGAISGTPAVGATGSGLNKES